jgi:ABC-type ATPase involved in cell division/GNAT superfamily N-acetyltransferase
MTTLKSYVCVDEIVKQVSSAFDYKFDGVSNFEIPSPVFPQDYSIGLIVGPSGSGKSSLLSSIGKEEEIEWLSDKAICSHFDSYDDARSRLAAVGLNSVPSWVKPYYALSNGEQFRARLARMIKTGAVIDEFTSVVDRKVAASCSYATQKYIRTSGINRVVFATCHYDVIEWLQPDWVYDTAEMKFRGSERRPETVLELLPCTTEPWSLFSKHHYLSAEINRSSRCWIALWDGQPVGFASVIAMPNPKVKNAWRGHRTVVLPEFQGMGFGVAISDAVAKIIVYSGCRYFSKTSNYAMGMHREKSPEWRATSKNKMDRQDYKSGRPSKEDGHKANHADRWCFSHEYISN